MTIRLIAVDIDGTLLDPADRVTPGVAAAVARAQAAGVTVVPVTGRPDRLIWDVSAEAGLRPLGSCSNGAVLVDLEAGTIVHRSRFTAAQAGRLVELIRAAVPGVLLAADEGDVFSFEPALFDGLGLPARRGREQVPDVATRVGRGCLKLVARRADLSSLALAELLSPVLRAATASGGAPEPAEDAGGMNEAGPGDLAEVTASDIAWVDIGPVGLTKATGLRDVCQRLGVDDAAEVAAVGDHFNDLPMLRYAGLAGAMGNAIPDVMDAADVVLPSNAEDGVAAFVDEVLARR